MYSNAGHTAVFLVMLNIKIMLWDVVKVYEYSCSKTGHKTFAA